MKKPLRGRRLLAFHREQCAEVGPLTCHRTTRQARIAVVRIYFRVMQRRTARALTTGRLLPFHVTQGPEATRRRHLVRELAALMFPCVPGPLWRPCAAEVWATTQTRRWR